MLSMENGFLKNDFPETILRRKPFYVETNGALITYPFFYTLYRQYKKVVLIVFLPSYFSEEYTVISDTNVRWYFYIFLYILFLNL
jgi:hypothetical protein